MDRVERTARIERSTLDKEKRQFSLVLSTSAPFPGRFGSSEILVHSPQSVSLPPGGEGLPLVVAHNLLTLPVGRVKPELKGDRLMGEATLSRGQLASDILNDIEDGILTDVSIGADVQQWDRSTNVARATQWTPIEASLVAVGADPSAKIQRGGAMPDDNTVTVPDQAQVRRTADIRNLFTGLDSPELKDLKIEALEDPKMDLEVVRSKVMEFVKAGSTVINQGNSQDPKNVQAGEDESDKVIRAMEHCMTVRMGLAEHDPKAAKELDTKARETEYYGSTLMDMARGFLRVNNVSLQGRDPGKIADMALVTRAGGIISHSSGDFANLLGNVSNKTLAQAYEQTPTTFQQWTGVGSLSDFKTADIINTSGFSDVDEIVNDEEYTYGTMADKKEQATLQTFGKLISFGRKLLINDDLDGLSRTTRAMGRAQARKLNATCYAILTNGASATMNEDSIALFNTATHNNLIASGSAPTVAALDAMDTDMGTQKALAPSASETGATMNLEPAIIIVPRALRNATATLLAAEVNPAEGSTTSFTEPNIWRGRLRIVSDAVLDATSAVAWYLSASPSVIDTVTVFYLNGQQTPMLESEEGFTRDGVTWKTRFDHTVAALDWRGLAKNNGA